MKLFICMILVALPHLTYAGICDSQFTEKTVTQAALSLETINGGGHALAIDTYSLSSEANKWIVVFTYSGVQTYWSVRTSADGCLVMAVSR